MRSGIVAKISFGEGGLKGFLSQHVEKLILGVVLLMVAFFIFSSATQEGVADGDPKKLESLANSALSHIQRDAWESMREEREGMQDNYFKLAVESRAPVDEKNYYLAHPWKKGLLPQQAKRSDPKFFPPLEVIAAGVVAPVAMMSKTDPWSDDEVAIVIEEEKKKPRRRPRRRTAPGGTAGYGPESYGGESSGGSGSGAGAFDYGGGEGSDESSADYGPGLMTPGAGADSGVSGNVRTVSSEFIKHYTVGFTLDSGMGGMASGGGGDVYGPGGGGAAQGPQGPIPRAFGVISVNLLAPFEKQVEAYEKALMNSSGYNPRQDFPNYIAFEAQRAEVPDDPNAPLDWKLVLNTQRAMKLAIQNYPAKVPELADPVYLLPGVLTMPIPPVINRPLGELALHPKIPRMKPQEVQTIQPQGPVGDGNLASTEIDADADPGAIPVNPQGAGYGAGGTEYGAGYSGDSGGYSTGGGTDAYGAGSGGTDAYGAGSGGTDAYGADGYGADGYGAGGDPTLNQPLVKYKLVRFFDFVKPGKKYRYRVRLLLEDPNRPRNPSAQPNIRILTKDVQERLEKVAEEEEKLGRRLYYVNTEWSEPSNVVSLDIPKAVVAGGVVAPRRVPLKTGGPSIEMGEPSAKVLTVKWDGKRAVQVPGEAEVVRGSVLNFTKDADVLHPTTKQIMRLKEVKFSDSSFVADLRGGDILPDQNGKLPSSKDADKALKAPGEIMVIDAQGNLIVKNEVDDEESFRRLTFEDSFAPAESMGGLGGLGGADDAYGGGDIYGGDLDTDY